MADSSQTSLQLPLIDFSQPLLPCTLSSISQACRDWGFFHIINHGVSKDLYNRLYALSSQAFNLPLDTKHKLGPLSHASTYTPRFIASPFFESLRVSGPNYFASAKSSNEALFDPPNSEFCDVFQEYGNKMMDLSKKTVSTLLNCLGDDFEAKYREAEFGSCHGYLRVNNYSPPETFGLPGAEGLGKHTDMSCVTVLYQDEVGGLQVRSRGDEWTDIPPREGALVVNVGDLLQSWSNGRLRSSEHRVVLRRPARRFSLAYFWCFEDEKVVSAPEGVVGEGNRRLYRPFLCRDYIKFRESDEKGRFDKAGYTVDDFAVTTSTQSKELDSRRTVSL